MLRWLWRGTLLTLALTGLLGAALLAAGAINELTARILGTSLTLSGASLLAMANVAAWDRRRHRWMAALGGLGVLSSAIVVLASLWIDDQSLMGPGALQLFVATLGFTHGSFLSLSRPSDEHRWIRDATIAATLMGAAFVCGLIQFDVEGGLPLRLLAAHSVIVATGSVLSLLLHRRSSAGEGETWSLRCTCPRCREDLRLAAGPNDCPKCGLQIGLRFGGP